MGSHRWGQAFILESHHHPLQEVGDYIALYFSTISVIARQVEASHRIR